VGRDVERRWRLWALDIYARFCSFLIFYGTVGHSFFILNLAYFKILRDVIIYTISHLAPSRFIDFQSKMFNEKSAQQFKAIRYFCQMEEKVTRCCAGQNRFFKMSYSSMLATRDALEKKNSDVSC
jgi:hypothetical protein